MFRTVLRSSGASKSLISQLPGAKTGLITVFSNKFTSSSISRNEQAQQQAPIKSRKEYVATTYKRIFEQSPIILFAHRNNLLKSDQHALAQQFHQAGAVLNVVNSSYLKAFLSKDSGIALSEGEVHPLTAYLSGPSALITINEPNPEIVAKVLKITKSVNEKLFIIGARVDGEVFDLEKLNKFKDLPSKSQLQSELVGLLTILSGAGLVRTLEAASHSLYFTLQNHKENIDPESEYNKSKAEEKAE